MKALKNFNFSLRFLNSNFNKNLKFFFSTNQNVIDLSKPEDFDNIISSSNIPVMVDFYADWCGPCKMLTPKLINKQQELKNFKLLKINVDNHQELAEKYDVQGIPHVLLFKNGQKVSEFVGINENGLKKMLDLI